MDTTKIDNKEEKASKKIDVKKALRETAIPMKPDRSKLDTHGSGKPRS